MTVLITDYPTCPRCERDLEPVSGDFKTGVSADGYDEREYREGFYCAKCEMTYDADDIEEDQE